MSKTRVQHGTPIFLHGTAGTDSSNFTNSAFTGKRVETSRLNEGDFKVACHGVSLYAEYKTTTGTTDDFQIDIYPYDTTELDALVTVSAKTFLLVQNGTTYVSDKFDLPVTVFGLGFTPKIKMAGSTDTGLGRLWAVPYWVEPF